MLEEQKISEGIQGLLNLTDKSTFRKTTPEDAGGLESKSIWHLPQQNKDLFNKGKKNAEALHEEYLITLIYKKTAW